MRIPRGLLPATLSLTALSFIALATQPSTPAPVLSAGAGSTTTTVVAPPTTTTTAPVVTTTVVPRPATTVAAAPRVTTPPAPVPAPPTTARPARASGKAESCGWQWDAIRIDDGSSNEVTMTLDAPRRPNEAVTITAAFGGPDTPDASHATTTDGAGQATTKFIVSEDKRDWTITISAAFPAGGVCPPQTFTLDY